MKDEIITLRAEIKTSEIIKTVREAALSCYGVVGFSDKASISRVEKITKKGQKEEAILVKKSSKNFDVEVYLILASNVKITETLVSAQDTIKYYLKKTFGISVGKVNLYAQAISSK